MKTILTYIAIILALHIPVLAITTIANPGPVGRPQAGGGGGFDETGLLLWADLTGDLVNDANPGTNDGVGVNTPTYVTDPFGNASSALLCVGASTDRSAKWTDAASLEMTDDFSIVFWIRSDAGAGSPGPVITKYSTAPNLSFTIEWQGSANDRFIVRYSDDGTTVETETTSGTNYPDDDSWMHIAAVYDESANQMVIYKNGVSTSTVTWATETGAWFNGTAPWRIGALASDSDGTYLAAARFSLWSRVLTAGEVTSLYNGGADVRYADLSGL